MNLPSFGMMLLSAVISLGGIGRGQTQAKPTPPTANASTKDPFDSFQSFSATLNGGMGNDHDRKIYRSGNLMRFDFEDSYRITDLGKKVTWGVDTHSCTKLEVPDAASFPFSAYRGFKVERSLTGEKETVDGHICTIENVTFTPTDGRPLVVTMKLWEAEDLERFPIKIELEPSGAVVKQAAKMSISYTNVSLNQPDATLFKHPAKCTGPAQSPQKGPAKGTPQTAPKPAQAPKP